MTVYDGGIEIQVATDEKYRRHGLALSCAAALIQECTIRKIRPCWDAANLISKKMALRLGYEYKGEYPTIHMKRLLPQNEEKTESTYSDFVDYYFLSYINIKIRLNEKLRIISRLSFDLSIKGNSALVS